MKKDYLDAISKYLKYNYDKSVNDGLGVDTYIKYNDSLLKLSLKLLEYNDNSNGAYKILTNDEYKELDILFKNAIKISNEFINSPHKGNIEMDKFRKEVANTLHNEFISKAFVEFQNVKNNPNLSLKEAMDKYKEETITLKPLEFKEIEEKNEDKINLSEEINGTFTKTLILDNHNNSINKIYEVCKRYPKYNDFFKFIASDDELIKGFYSKAYKVDNVFIDENGINPNYINSINNLDMDLDDEYYQEYSSLFVKYVTDEEFALACADLGNKLNDVFKNENIYYSNLKLRTKDNIDKRALAVTSIAQIFEVSEITKSRNIKFETNINDKTLNIEGTYTDKPVGKNLVKLPSDDFIRSLKKEDIETIEAKRSLSNLQIIDYICGNVNRNINNTYFNFDKNTHKLLSVEGNNNEFSFIKDDININGSILNFSCLNDIKVIDEEMAFKILSIDEAVLKASLIGNGLDNKEIEMAVLRTNKLKEALEKGMIYDPKTSNINDSLKSTDPTILIVKQEDWKNLSFEELGSNTKNIFNVTNNSFNNLNKELKIDKTLMNKVGILNGTLRCKIEDGNNFLVKARANKPLFGTSNRYSNFIKSLELYNSSRNMDEKILALKDVRVNVDIYKKEKIRDGVLDLDGNLLKKLSGKDLARVNLVKEVDAFINEIDKINKEKLIAHENRVNDVKLVDDVNSKYRLGKYANYPKAFFNEEGKIYINKEILKRDDASFKELADYSKRKNNTNSNYVNKTNILIKKQLELDYNHGRIPKEYLDYRLDKLNNQIYDEDSLLKFEPASPDSDYFKSEFTNKLQKEVDDNFIDNDDKINIQNNVSKQNEIDNN